MSNSINRVLSYTVHKQTNRWTNTNDYITSAEGRRNECSQTYLNKFIDLLDEEFGHCTFRSLEFPVQILEDHPDDLYNGHQQGAKGQRA